MFEDIVVLSTVYRVIYYVESDFATFEFIMCLFYSNGGKFVA